MSNPIEAVVEKLTKIRSMAKETQNFIDAQLKGIPEIEKRVCHLDMLE